MIAAEKQDDSLKDDSSDNPSMILIKTGGNGFPAPVDNATAGAASLADSNTQDSHMSSLLARMNPARTIHLRPLLILDLNGILCHRLRKHDIPQQEHAYYRPSIGRVANTHIIPRIHLEEFLNGLSRHFCLAVWTSAKAKTASKLLQLLIKSQRIRSQLLFVWSQEQCDNACLQQTTDDDNETAQNVMVKDLSKVWEAFPLWNSETTLLLDDTRGKSGPHPQNAVHPPPLNGRVIVDVAATTQGDAAAVPANTDGANHHCSNNDVWNERQQQAFFNQLAQHWTENPIVHTIPSGDDNGQEAQQPLSSLPYQQEKSQLSFLQQHATEHMGW